MHSTYACMYVTAAHGGILAQRLEHTVDEYKLGLPLSTHTHTHTNSDCSCVMIGLVSSRHYPSLWFLTQLVLHLGPQFNYLHAAALD